MAQSKLIAFDTHEKVKELEGAGFNSKQAEAQVKILKDLLGGEVATKKDIELSEVNLNNNLNLLESKMESMGLRLENKIESLESKMESMESRLENKIESIESRLESKTESIESKMESMESRLETKMEKLNATTIKWMASTVLVNTGLIFGILKYLH